MTVDNLSLGPEGQANHALSVLHRQTCAGDLTSRVDFVPGVFLNSDPALALSGQWRAPEERLLELDAQTNGTAGGWMGLHIVMPASDLRQKALLGFATRIAAPESVLIRACLRSGQEGGFVDSFFNKHLLFTSEAALHLDAMELTQRDDVPAQALWREVVFFLPPRSFKLSFLDLRLFLL